MPYFPPDTTVSASVEIGTVQPFRFTPSSSWLPLEGGTFNYNDYPALGALYGGSPGGTFAVDDFRGRAIYAADGTNPSGTRTGSDTADLSHTHGVGSLSGAAAGGHTHTTGASGSTNASLLGIGLGPVAPSNHTHTVSTVADHSHALSGSTASGGLASFDRRPARGYLRLYIRAVA